VPRATKEPETPTEEEPEVIEGEATEEPLDAAVVEEARNMEVAIREERESFQPPAAVLPSPKEWEATIAVAARIASTPFVPESYRGQPEAVVAAILTGREMGIGPMQALRQIHMIDGRPAFAADLMLAKMREGGLTILDSGVDAQRAYIHAKRRDTGEEATVEWTIADAEAAGLMSKKNWRTYPGDMLWARCVGRLARRLGSDLVGGLVYSKEEMEDWDEGPYGGSYGVGEGYEATTDRAFDPGTDVLVSAHRGDGFQQKIADGLKYKRADIDWRAVITQAWEGERTTEFWKRLSNFEAKLATDHPHEMPPINDEEVIQAIAWAFNGVVVEITTLPTEEPKTSRSRKSKDEPGDAALSPEAQQELANAPEDGSIDF
jgi:hypothetical protein